MVDINLNLNARLEAISGIAKITGSSFSLDNGEISIWSKGDKPTEEEIQSKMDSVAYARNRALEYPAIAEQLDILYHSGVAGLKAELKKTKDKFPKG